MFFTFVDNVFLQIQLIHCRRTLAHSICEKFSVWTAQVAQRVEKADKLLYHYNLIESIAETSIETVSIGGNPFPSSDICSGMKTMLNFVPEYVETCTDEELLYLVEQLVDQQDTLQSMKQCLYFSSQGESLQFWLEECLSIVECQKWLLWNFQDLSLDFRSKCSEYRDNAAMIFPDEKYVCNSCSNETDKVWIETCACGDEETTEQMLKNIQQQLPVDSSIWVSDDKLEAILSKLAESVHEIESDRNALEQLDTEIQSLCNELQRNTDSESSREKIQQLCYLSGEAEDSIKVIHEQHKEEHSHIISLEKYKFPVVANHFWLTDESISNNYLDADLKDSDAEGQLLFGDRQQGWRHLGDLLHFSKTTSAHGLLNYVVDVQVERDLALTSLRARELEYEMLNELISKEYSLTKMQQQLGQLQQYWNEEMSRSIEQTTSQLTKVSESLPSIRNLLDIWKFRPGLFIPQESIYK